MAVPRMFKNGGTVKKTGYAKVHEGETILTPEDSKELKTMANDRVAEALGGSKKPAKKSKSKKSHKKSHKKVKEMHIRHAANGGYIVKHDFANKPGDAEMAEPEEHQVGDLDQLHDHLDEHMQQPGEEEAQAPPAPPAGGAGPGGGASPDMA